MTDDKIKHMVDRFLGWRLPENFNPDAGISFQKTFNENTPYPMKHEPTGTNLFDASQAEEMIRYMLAEPAATEGTQEILPPGHARPLPCTCATECHFDCDDPSCKCVHHSSNVVVAPVEPVTPQTTELPEDFEAWWTKYLSGRSIDPFPEKAALWNAKQAAWSAWHAAPVTREREKDAEIERLKVQIGGRNIYIKSFQDGEEARMEELAALRTSRDALLKTAIECAEVACAETCDYESQPTPIHTGECKKAQISIAAARQLQEDGK